MCIFSPLVAIAMGKHISGRACVWFWYWSKVPELWICSEAPWSLMLSMLASLVYTCFQLRDLRVRI